MASALDSGDGDCRWTPAAGAAFQWHNGPSTVTPTGPQAGPAAMAASGRMKGVGRGAVGPVSDTVGNNINSGNMVFVCKRRDDAHG